MRILILLILGCKFLTVNAAKFQDTMIKIASGSAIIEGTLTRPDSNDKDIFVLFISGSGPTDRDGNQAGMRNNSIRFLAEYLAKNGISSFRYDKRGVGKSEDSIFGEERLRFEFFVNDAIVIFNTITQKFKFNRTAIAGHSEGSLVGMLAMHQTSADAFISLAGAGYPAGEILKKQLAANFGKSQLELKKRSMRTIQLLESGKRDTAVDVKLYSIFRPQLQPYLISWFKYKPQVEIKKIKKPKLIVNGDNDLQVSKDNAEKLFAANKKRSTLKIIPNMNHVLKEVLSKEKKDNMATYNNRKLENMPILNESVLQFLLNI